MNIVTFIASSGLFTLIGGILSFIYWQYYNLPKLNYEILPTYIMGDEKIVPVIFRNEGHAKATDIRIKISCSGPIQNLFEDIPEKFTSERDNQNVIIYRLDRFTKSIIATIYLKISSLSDEPINVISITSDQGPGHKYKKLTPLSLEERLGIVLTSFALGLLFSALLLTLIFTLKPWAI